MFPDVALPRERTLAVLQPGYLPWLGFFDQMRRADVFVHYDDVQYDTHGWRNRSRIKSRTGPLWLTVPVHHRGLGKPRILDVTIDSTAPWARKHLGTLLQFYKDAPYWSRYSPELAELLHRPWERLVDLNLALTAKMAAWLGVKACAHRASGLGIDGERSERLLKICQRFDATRYLSGNAARSYLDVDLFRRHGIVVEWQEYPHPTYRQLHGPFVPYLSAIDLILNCGEESSAILSDGAQRSE
jgi:hypothetical protein